MERAIGELRSRAANWPQRAIALTGIMPVFDSTARKQVAPEPTFRTAPHNIEAEQALLGAILVNNEAFYRVSDFLEAKHFFEPIHQRIFELAGGLIRASKVAPLRPAGAIYGVRTLAKSRGSSSSIQSAV